MITELFIITGLLNAFPTDGGGASLLLSAGAIHFADVATQIWAATSAETYLPNIARLKSTAISHNTASMTNIVDGDRSESSCVEVIGSGNEFWVEVNVGSGSDVNIDSVTVYGSPGSGISYSKDISIQAIAVDSTTYTCASGIDVTFYSQHPSYRALCNVNAARVRVVSASQLKICEVEVYSVNSLSHMKLVQSRAVSSVSNHYSLFSYMNSNVKSPEAPGFFRLALRYPRLEGANTNQWQQSSGVVDSEVMGYSAINTPFTANGWNGLKYVEIETQGFL